MTTALELAPAQALYPPTAAPSKRPLSLAPFLWTFLRNPLRTLPAAVYDEPLVAFAGHRKGMPGIVWVTGPDLLERVLLTDQATFAKTPLERRVLGPTLGDGLLLAEDQSWRWQRRLMAPLFRHQELTGHVAAMVSAAQVQIAAWRQRSADGAPVAVDRAMTDLTYDVITQTILAGAGAAEGRIIMETATALLNVVTWEIAAGILQIPAWVWHPGKGRARRGSKRLRTTVETIVARARTAEVSAPGLLGRLLAACDPDSGAPMSDTQIVDNLLTFLLAGHETTAKAMTWTLYLLARAPGVQDAMRREIESVLAGGPFDAAHIPRLPLTTRVLKEAMRLYPPAPFMTRVVTSDTSLGGRPIARGTMVNIPIYALHRHRRLWDDPDRFDPDRFSPEREAGYARTQYMPFGYGPRTCIGASFAMIEATALLATLLPAARFSWGGTHQPTPVSRITLRPTGGMPLLVDVL